jgi:hypothetical protein
MEKTVEELKVKLEEQDNQIEDLNERVEIEQEEAEKAIQKAKE